MDNLLKVKNDKGIYSCDQLAITTSEWLELIQKPKTAKYVDDLLRFMLEPNHSGSCSQVAKHNGDSPQHYNVQITQYL